MELKVTTLEGKEAGSVQLSDAIFGLEPRADIIQRCVQWQLNKRQAGTHKAKGRAEIWRTGKKMYKQKGTGGARHGSARVPQFRGGGRAFGPVVRSHETGLPKKVRALALKHALSAKAKDGGLIVITFDEGSDAAACCGETSGISPSHPNVPLPGKTGPGGGRTGAVLLSPLIRPGTVSTVAYNHYSLLRSIEDIFGLPHLGDAAMPQVRSFGPDVFG